MNNLNNSDKAVLRGIQKNAQMALDAIHSISGKVYDDALALDLNRQALKYTDIKDRAINQLLDEKQKPKNQNKIEHAMLWGSIQANTLLNSSTSHIAEMVIQGSNRGITDMCKSLNRYQRAGEHSMEIAKELMDFEEKNIERLKKYL